MENLHTAVCGCDNSQRKRLITNNSWVLETAQKYAEIVGGGVNTLKD